MLITLASVKLVVYSTNILTCNPNCSVRNKLKSFYVIDHDSTYNKILDTSHAICEGSMLMDT